MRLLRSDFQRYKDLGSSGSYLRIFIDNQGLWAIACYRFGYAISNQGLMPIIRPILKLVYYFWNKGIEITTGISISPDATIGSGLYIGHFSGVFVGRGCVLGENCNISHGVTLGIARRGGKWGVPIIGDRVYIAPGAKIVGPVTIGSDCVIGANSVMTRDAPASSVWVCADACQKPSHQSL